MASSLQRRRVLIAGCGLVGSALGGLLADRGHTVFGLRRNPERLAEGIHPLAADLLAPDLASILPGNLDFVFYTASSDSRTDLSYEKAYVRGPRNLLGSLSQQNQQLTRIFFTSSTRVYGQTNGDWVNEDSATEPLDWGGRRLLEGEKCFSESPFPSTTVRLSGIYGPGRNRLLRRLYRGEESCPDEGVFTNRIHVTDCAGALAFLMESPHPKALYIGVDCLPVERCELLSWLAAQLDVPPPRRSDSTRPRSRGNKRCSNRRLLDEGYLYRYPTYRDGYPPLAASFLQSQKADTRGYSSEA
jgi:nucleoside-diphosphate-sugar epimerase